jgi:hypothetical protein
MSQEVMQNLGRIMDDPQATADERSAATQLWMVLPYGGRPTKDQAHIISGYIQRQQAQNRWGK